MVRDNPYLPLAVSAVGGMAPYEPGKPAAELERELGLSGVIKLASNENPLGPSPRVQAALAAALQGLERYPDGAGFELREALARQLAVNPDQLTLGNGSNELLVMLAETFLAPGRSAVYDEFSFVVYRLAVQATGAEARIARSRPRDHEQPLGHDLDAMLALVDASTRLVFIANPNNPTGSWLEPAELRAFLDALPAQAIVVLDEAYLEYASRPGDDLSIGWLQRYPNLVLLRTFSKAYGLAGLRVGYAVSAAGIAELLNRVRQPFNVNSLAQAAALAALGDQDWVERAVTTNAAMLARLREGLQALGLDCLPSRGNFVLAGFESPSAAGDCHGFLLRAGVIVRPVANYGLPSYLRISTGTAQEIERLLAAMSDWRKQA